MTTFLTIAATAIVTAAATAFAQHISTQKIESEKTIQKRQAVGIMIQAELVRLHMDLKQHGREMEGFVAKTERGVGVAKESDFPKFETNGGFQIFHGLMTDIGLFDPELSYQIVYCYFNCEKFLMLQKEFIRDLPGKLNTTMLSNTAKNFAGHETALLSQIARVIPLIAKQSRAIPFNPAAG